MRLAALTAAPLLGGALLVGGCGGWHKPGAVAGEFERDHYACQRENTFTTADGMSVHVGLTRDCLRAKGWVAK